VFVAIALAAEAHPVRLIGQSTSASIEALQVRSNFYMIAGAGANVAVQLGPDGVVVIDSGAAAKADQLIAEIKKLAKQPIRYVVNTSASDDHVGGNEKLSLAGESVIPTGGLNNMAAYGGRAVILAEEHVQSRLSAPTGKQSRLPEAAWPTSTYSSASGENRKDVYINGEAMQLFYQPAAYSDADSVVFFRRSDVIVAGEVFDITRFPLIDVEHGGSVQGVIAGLNRIIDIAVPPIPMVWQEGGTLVIPAHGRICSKDDVVGYRDMVTIVRDRVQDGIKKGLPLDQIKRANPTQGYRKRFGADSGPWTTDNFVEAVYKSLRK